MQMRKAPSIFRLHCAMKAGGVSRQWWRCFGSS